MNEQVPRCILEVESTVSGEYVQVTMWHEKAKLADVVRNFEQSTF